MNYLPLPSINQWDHHNLFDASLAGADNFSISRSKYQPYVKTSWIHINNFRSFADLRSSTYDRGSSRSDDMGVCLNQWQ